MMQDYFVSLLGPKLKLVRHLSTRTPTEAVSLGKNKSPLHLLKFAAFMTLRLLRILAQDTVKTVADQLITSYFGAPENTSSDLAKPCVSQIIRWKCKGWPRIR